jgi:hypothetical protein
MLLHNIQHIWIYFILRIEEMHRMLQINACIFVTEYPLKEYIYISGNVLADVEE